MKKADKILIIVIIVIVITAYFIMNIWGCEPVLVDISYDGMSIGEYKITDDVIIETEYGNVIEIRGGQVEMLSADCPDSLCIRQGIITANGQSIICLPNKTIVQILY